MYNKEPHWRTLVFSSSASYVTYVTTYVTAKTKNQFANQSQQNDPW